MKLAQSLIAILLGLSVLTQQVRADDEAPWYDIELILFKQDPSSVGNTEQWPDDPSVPDWSNAIYLAPASGTGEDPLSPYTLLPKSQWRLTSLFNALHQTGGEIEPLLHQAWRQPVMSPKEARPIHLGSGETSGLPGSLTEGLIKISVNRYLHVNLDLLLRRVNTNSSITREIGESVSSPANGNVRFMASRRMRSGELHYIDHPKMGALILISRVEAPQPISTVPEPPKTAAQDTSPPAVPREAEKAIAKPAAN